MQKLEHVAIQVADARAMADWYGKQLNMAVVRSGPPPRNMTFLADASGRTCFELYERDDTPLPDYASMNPFILHMAFTTDDIEADRSRLIDAGATEVAPIDDTDAGDRLAMLRDPWGLSLQLVQRKEAMP
jgi:uncharacterized glyoxalase superfamily protein PhnB